MEINGSQVVGVFETPKQAPAALGSLRDATAHNSVDRYPRRA